MGETSISNNDKIKIYGEKKNHDDNIKIKKIKIIIIWNQFQDIEKKSFFKRRIKWVKIKSKREFQ